MKPYPFVVATVAAALILPALASTHDAPLRETVTVAADKPIPNVPGKRLVSVIVDYPPGASSIPHRHARSAFIYAYVLSGKVRSQVDDEPVRIYRPGEWWFESPGPDSKSIVSSCACSSCERPTSRIPPAIPPITLALSVQRSSRCAVCP